MLNLASWGCQCKGCESSNIILHISPEPSDTTKLFRSSNTEHLSSNLLYKLYKKDMNIVRVEIVFQLLVPEAVYYTQFFHTFHLTSSY